jgi:hemerythrin-like metal-binding protein
MMKKPTWTIKWEAEMSVGIPEIDEDHKQFFVMINLLNRSIIDRMDPAEIKKRMLLIIKDAERHFSQEEKLFKEWQYSDIDAHASSHKRALEALYEVNEKFIPYGFDSAWVDAGLRVKRILVDHILNEDMKYAKFYRSSLDVDSEVQA